MKRTFVCIILFTILTFNFLYSQTTKYFSGDIIKVDTCEDSIKDGNDNGQIAFFYNYVIRNEIFMLYYNYSDTLLEKLKTRIENVCNSRDDVRKVVSRYVYNDTTKEMYAETLATWRAFKYSTITVDSADTMYYYATIYRGEEYRYGPDYGFPKDTFAVPYFMHQGLIISVILQFVELVDYYDKWDFLYSDLPPFIDMRKVYINFCKEAYEVFAEDFVDIGDSMGYFINSYKNLSNDTVTIYPQYPYIMEGWPSPINHEMCFAEGIGMLGYFTNNTEHISRAKKIVRYFKSLLDSVSLPGTYIWKYSDNCYAHRGAGDREDISHGGFSVRALDVIRKHIDISSIFNEDEMSKFAKTITQNVVYPKEPPPGYEISSFLDGTENKFMDYDRSIYYFWWPYCRYDMHIHEIASKNTYRVINNIKRKYYSEKYNYEPYKIVYKEYYFDSTKREDSRQFSLTSINNYKTMFDTIVMITRIVHPYQAYSDTSDTSIYVLTRGDSIEGLIGPIDRDKIRESDTICKVEVTSYVPRYSGYKMFVSQIIDTVVFNVKDSLFVFIDTPEIPVLSDAKIVLNVCDRPINKPVYGVKNAYVKIENNDILLEGYTDEYGHIEFNVNTSSTDNIIVSLSDFYYLSGDSIIHPYMWTTDRWANEGNNKSRISRKPNTEQLYMVYSDGDRIIGCESFNYGKYWGLNVLGEGKDPVMVRMGDSIIVVWKVDEYNLGYVIKSSPWEAPSYLPPVMTSSEFVMTRDPMKSNIWGGYLVKRYLNQEGADYVFMKWDDIGNSDIIDTMIVVPYTGDEKNIVPDRNPVTSHYETPLSGGTQPLIGFIDTTNIYRGKMWDERDQWNTSLFSISDESKYANHASIDGYGTKTVFVWEEWEGGLSKIASRTMENGVMGNIEYITDYGNNTNPKTKGGAVYGWVNKDKTIKTDKEILGNKTGIVYSSNDSISGMDFDLLPYEFDNKLLVKAYYTWIEGNNEEYRIKGKAVNYKNDILPLYTLLSSNETIIKSEESVLSEYVRGNRDIEEYEYISSGIDNQKYYKGIITLEGNNSTIPIGILLEDGSVEYVYVRGNERVIKEIDIPQGTYEDREIEIKIQRVKGNPNRDIKVELKEYERLSEEGVEMVKTDNRELLMDKVYESKSSGIINNIVSGELKYGISKKGKVSISIYDISGRCVMEKEESILEAGIYRERINFLKKGVYFVILKTEEESIKEKIIVIK